MKTNLLFLMLAAAIIFAGCKKDDDETPPYAATTQTWTFGNQTWSDAIHCPECNKETFEISYTTPQCQSYTENGKTWYYYNWPYVNANKTTMCPSPWRVPTKEDFETLVSTLGGDTQTARDAIADAWGYGGAALGSSMHYENSIASYWSSTVYSSNTNNAYHLFGYDSDNLVVGDGDKLVGLQVRCVK